MEYSRQTIDNPSFIKRFSHNRRFQRALQMCAPKFGSTLLDYGTGDAFFLKLICDSYKGLNATGYETDESRYHEAVRNTQDYGSITITNDINEVSSRRFNIITCFELFEHLNRDDQETVLERIELMLDEDGKIIVSVPIETGLSGFLKNLARIAIGQGNDIRFTDLFKVLLGKRVLRDYSKRYYFSHIGFNHDDVRELIRSRFLIKRVSYSPLPFIRRLLNSQVFYEIVRKPEMKDI